MATQQNPRAYIKDRAEREIALAKAVGARAYATADYRTVIIERPDGTTERVHIPEKPS